MKIFGNDKDSDSGIVQQGKRPELQVACIEGSFFKDFKPKYEAWLKEHPKVFIHATASHIGVFVVTYTE